ncbi:uncharacterized protein C2845_PM01G31670 [Panicum miliaceum]|uniref:Uncharacterized protein n=1 Tax=Panicum miliaceum TaxID=4540 RepID=A0A3L6TJA0_PANMI|nr:uncharacterized protein C2845_PM01G31670 [Panicum miliaceum]
MEGQGGGYHDFFSQASSSSTAPQGPTSAAAAADDADLGIYSQPPWYPGANLENLDLNSHGGVTKQSKVIIACMAIHNFIRESAMGL